MIKHVGRYDTRCNDGSHSGVREAAFRDEWQKENAERGYTDPLLFELIHRVKQDDHWNLRNDQYDAPLNQKEATDAATIIQWLGTNVGWCFLEMALKRCGYKIVRANPSATPAAADSQTAAS